MDTLKKPEMIVSLTTAVSLVGASVYFYKKIHGQEEELNKLSGNLANTIQKVGEMQHHGHHIQELSETIKQLNGEVSKQRDVLSELRTAMDYHQECIQIIVEAMREIGGYDIKIPRPTRSMDKVHYSRDVTPDNYDDHYFDRRPAYDDRPPARRVPSRPPPPRSRYPDDDDNLEDDVALVRSARRNRRQINDAEA